MSLERLCKSLGSLPQRLFEQEVGVPCLVVTALGDGQDGHVGLTAQGNTGELVPVDDARALVFPVRKSPRNAFGEMITFGRSPTNDLVLVSKSISNFHAYFVQTAEGWGLVDADSQNGTRVAGELLESQKVQPLPFGSLIQFAQAAEMIFLDPPRLYRAVQNRL